MNLLRSLILVIALAPLAIGLTACEEKGTAEKAGEKIDETMEKAEKGLKDALGK